MASNQAQSGRFLPYNLSSVVPFEPTAAALQVLPTLQPRAPAERERSNSSKTKSRETVDAETIQIMHGMIAESLQETEWNIPIEEDIAPLTKDPVQSEKWMEDLAATLPAIVTKHVRMGAGTQPTNAFLSTQGRDLPAHESAVHAVPSSSTDAVGGSDRNASANVDYKTADHPAVAAKQPVHQGEQLEPRMNGNVQRDQAPDHHQRNQAKKASSRRPASPTRRQRPSFSRTTADSETVLQFQKTLHALTDKVALESRRTDFTHQRAVLSATGKPKYLGELFDNIRIHVAMQVVPHIPQDLLREALNILVARARFASRAVRKRVQNADSANIENEAALGVMASNCVLALLTSRDLPRSMLLQDDLDQVLDMLQNILTHVVYPACDPLYESPQNGSHGRPATRPGANRARATGSHGRDEDERAFHGVPNGSMGESSSKGADNVGDSDVEDTDTYAAERKPGRSRKPMSPSIQRLMAHCCTAFDTLSVLLAAERGLSDSFVTSVVNLVVSSLPVSGVVHLQLVGCKVAEAVAKSYAEHDGTLMDEIREALCRLPVSKRDWRRYTVEDSPEHVRVASAMLVRVLTAIGARGFGEEGLDAGIASYDEAATSTHSAADTLRGHADEITASRDEARRLVARLSYRFAIEIMNRALLHRNIDTRTAVHVAVEDLLVLHGLPEWPSAEVLLQALCIRVILNLKDNAQLSVFDRSVCLDLLGTIAARLSRALDVSPGTAPNTTETTSHAEHEAESKHLASQLTVLRYLDSRSGSGLAAQHALCYLLTQFAREQAEAREETSKRSPHPSGAPDQKAAPGVEPSESETGATMQAKQRAIDEYRKRLTRALRDKESGDSPSRAAAIASVISLGRERNFGKQLPRVVDTIRGCLALPEPTLRAKAVKALAGIVDASPNALHAMPSIVAGIEESCMDVSRGVREASLDLLSRSVSMMWDGNASTGMRPPSGLTRNAPQHANPEVMQDAEYGDTTQKNACTERFGGEFFERVFPVVEQRLIDSAVSVRKRAVSILHDVLNQATKAANAIAMKSTANGHSDHESKHLEGIIARLCFTLSERLDDPETSVKTATERALRHTLLGLDSTSMESWSARADDADVASTYANRIVDVFCLVARSPRPTNTQLSILSYVVHDAVVVKRRRLLDGIVAEVVEMLDTIESRLVRGFEATNARAGRDEPTATVKSAEELSIRRVACSVVIEAFANVESKLVAPHCRSLASSIKGVVETRRRSSADLLHTQKVLSSLELAIPGSLGPKDAPFLEEVVHDTEKIVCQCPSSAIAPAAIKCFCALAKCSTDPHIRNLPAETATVFLDFLSEAKDELAQAGPQSNSEKIRNAKQAFPRLGLLARYGECSSTQASAVYDVLGGVCVGMLDAKQPVVSVGKGAQQQPFVLRLCAIRALCHFLTRHRGFLAAATPTLLACLRPMAPGNGTASAPCTLVDFNLQRTVLEGLHDMLSEEESRNVSEAKKIGKSAQSASKGARGDVVLAAEEDAEAGHLAACAQALVPELCHTSRGPRSDVRVSVAQILGLLARQGLVLPAKIVPALFGLLTDAYAPSREAAMVVIKFLSERHPGMLSSATLAGVESCMSFCVAVDAGPREGSERLLDAIRRYSVDAKSGHALLSPALMSVKREQRRGILRSMLRDFDPLAKLVQKSPVASDEAGEQTRNSEAGAAMDGVAQANEAMNVAHGSAFGDGDEFDIGIPRADQGNEAPSLSLGNPPRAVARLLFFASTIATLDYTAGAGIGGSFTVGGGTAAADARLKAAREDVSDLVSFVSRTIANSGQATLQAASCVLASMRAGASIGSTSLPLSAVIEITHSAVPLSMLLQLKYFLTETRWYAGNAANKQRSSKSNNAAEYNNDPQDEQDTSRCAPPFDLAEHLPLLRAYDAAELARAGPDWSPAYDNCELDELIAQLRSFVQQMHDDAVDDEGDARPESGTAAQRKRRASAGARGSARGRNPKRRRESAAGGATAVAKPRRADALRDTM